MEQPALSMAFCLLQTLSADPLFCGSNIRLHTHYLIDAAADEGAFARALALTRLSTAPAPARAPTARARSRSRGAPTPERAPRPPQGAARLAAREVHQQIDELSEWLQAQQEQLNHIVGWIRRFNSRISALEHAVFGESEPEPTSDRSPG